mgnify:CR=1 FL=1
MPDIRFHPTGRLLLEDAPQDPEGQTDFPSLLEGFHSDWRLGFFRLAAETNTSHFSPSMRFWREIAADYLTKLCHLPGSEQEVSVEPPAESTLLQWVQEAPPMTGGEYLSAALLEKTFSALDQWGSATISAEGGVDAFLQKRAPDWNRVGRVTFHLAENTKQASRPFAFMASFSTGIGAGGKVKHLPLGKALELYAGNRNKTALIKLLSPVNEAAKHLDWVQKLVDSGHIYRPLAWSPEQAYQLLCSTSTLKESGLSVKLPDWWKKRPKPQVKATIGQQKGVSMGVDSLLDFSVEVALGDTVLSPEELAEILSSQGGLVQLKGQWVEVDQERLQQAIDHWNTLKARTKNGGVSFVEGMRMLAGASTDLKHEDQSEEERPWVRVEAGAAMQEVLERLHEPARLEAFQANQDLRASLRSYQLEGVSWLDFLTELGLGACLADDMGLGKTLQVLALLAGRRHKKTEDPALLILPASLLGNWKNEAERFTPGLRLLILHPSETDKRTLTAMGKDPQAILGAYDLVVTTYSMVHRLDWLADQRWSLVILDEAQAVKNHATRQSRAVKKLPSQARIALTGTPIENRLSDLWSLFDFLNPGLLGSAKVFQDFVKTMESRTQNPFGPLRRLVNPYILRRLKTDRSIIADLPDKTETVRYCSLTTTQIRYYQQVVKAMQKGLETEDAMARRGLVLQTLMRLKQICNHPSQFTGDDGYESEHSGKFNRIREICQELAERQEKALIFTQFKEIIPALEEHLTRVFGHPGLVLHGSTGVKKRKGLVEQFQDEAGPPFFILSLKAGGTGLNLTAASHVIHFDRWWNPAVENQATDRAFRIGQNKNVLVHKFVTTGTIEERIHRLITEKQELAESLLTGSGEIKLTELPDEELLELVRLDVTRAGV